jgi:tripartite-type tricarboxylate transporter receptor subunit TctC
VKSKGENRTADVAGARPGSRRFSFRLASCVLLLGCALAPAAAPALAQSYPNRPVRLIVPAAPSGGLDIMARTIGQPLSIMWGQPVVADNRPGAGVMLGTELASKATPDGYTLLVVNANLAPNAILHDKLAVVKGLAAIVKIADLPNALAVPASAPVNSMSELLALAKSSKLTYGSAGHGTVGNILAEMLKLETRTDITHVPFKGGGPVMIALAGGQVSIGIVSLASTMSHAKAGRVKILAVSGASRSRLAPEIPTIGETVKGVELESWVGLLAPAGTPATLIGAVNAAVLKAIEQPETRQRLVAQGYDVQGGAPQDFAKLIRSDIARYSRVIREAGIKTH